VIKDIEGFNHDMLTYGYKKGVDYKILENTESTIILELTNIDPFEDFVTIHELIHDFDKKAMYEASFIKMTVKWEK